MTLDEIAGKLEESVGESDWNQAKSALNDLWDIIEVGRTKSAPEQSRCRLSDLELVEKAREWIHKLAKTGGKAWCLRIPVDFNHDPDMIFSELCDRLGGCCIDAALAEPVKPEPGDVVAWIWPDGDAHIEVLRVTPNDRWLVQHQVKIVVLMRAAEVKRRIEEAGK